MRGNIYAPARYLFLCVTLKCLSGVLLSSSGRIQRSILGNGLHRSLSSSLILPHENVEVMLALELQCTALFLEKIPSGAYVDPFQVSALREFGGPEVLIRDKVDIEKPQALSKSHTVMIFKTLQRDNEALIANYTIPVHLRYHNLSNGEEGNEFVSVYFGQPGVAINCYNTKLQMHQFAFKGKTVKTERLSCDSDNLKLCDWTFISPEYDEQGQEMSVSVPVGNSAHFLPVLVGTTAVTSFGCIFIVYHILHQNNNKNGRKGSARKQGSNKS